MEINTYILLIIIGSAIVTFLPRVLPLVVLAKVSLPDWAMRWLYYVPIAVMAALIGQELLLIDGKFTLLHNEKLLAALPTFLIAIITRSLLMTVVVGILSLMVVRNFFV